MLLPHSASPAGRTAQLHRIHTATRRLPGFALAAPPAVAARRQQPEFERRRCRSRVHSAVGPAGTRVGSNDTSAFGRVAAAAAAAGDDAGPAGNGPAAPAETDVPAAGAALSSAAPSLLGIEAEVLAVALPTLATLAADPLASLASTGFVGRLGAVPLASVGVALSVYNSSTKLLNMPLLAVTTSSVAQALGSQEGVGSKDGRSGDALASAIGAAIVLALVTGLTQAALLAAFGRRGLAMWGAVPGGPLHPDAAAFLGIRALAAPATVLMLVLQGCFRGLGDSRVPFVATLLASGLNIALEPLLIFRLGWAVRGAATAVGLSQAAACAVLLLLLHHRCPLRLVGGAALQRSLQYLGSTGLLACRTLAVMSVFSLGTSLAARTQPAHAAAHQIAFQVWLASSLLADSLAVAAQMLLARSIAAGQRVAGQRVVRRTLQMALVLGCLLAAGLALGQGHIARLFTSDPAVLASLALIMPAVIATQPINALVFLMDGVLYGVGGFRYAAGAMVVAAMPAGAAMVLGSKLAARLPPPAAYDGQLAAVWVGLATLMALRLATLLVPLLHRYPPFDKLQA